MTNDGTDPDAELVISPFNAVDEQNDYEVRLIQTRLLWLILPHGPPC